MSLCFNYIINKFISSIGSNIFTVLRSSFVNKRFKDVLVKSAVTFANGGLGWATVWVFCGVIGLLFLNVTLVL